MAREAARGRDIRVLIVDDQEAYRRAMAAVVDETEGFVIVGEAGTGEEAVDVAARVRPDLVLMDVNLPGIDGMEATRRIRGVGEARADAPMVVLVSTYDQDDFGPECIASGAAAYVTKAAFGPTRLVELWAGGTSDGSDTQS